MTQTIHAIEHLDSETLCAFIDGELATVNQREIHEHLTFCHPCALRALSASQLKEAIAHVGIRFMPYALDFADGIQIPQNDIFRSKPQANLFAALKQIQPPFREPLLFCDVESAKYHDIGAILDLPDDTVMSRISIARDTISQILQQQLEEPQ